jgi:hypothetical protein
MSGKLVVAHARRWAAKAFARCDPRQKFDGLRRGSALAHGRWYLYLNCLSVLQLFKFRHRGMLVAWIGSPAAAAAAAAFWAHQNTKGHECEQ